MTLARSAAVAAMAASLNFTAAAPLAAQTTLTQSAALAAKAAPADEYFGPLQLSVLGIANSIVQSTLRLDRVGLDESDSYKSVTLVEASIRDWETKYPNDVWLPRTILALHRVYRRMTIADASLHAVDVAAWLLAKYPNSNEARGLRTELAGQLAPVTEVTVTASNQ